MIMDYVVAKEPVVGQGQYGRIRADLKIVPRVASSRSPTISSDLRVAEADCQP